MLIDSFSEMIYLEIRMFRNFRWLQRLFILMISGLFILSVSSILSGCGNKGDLYLPDTGSKTDSKTNPVKKKS
ncbi:MAG: putative small lipoprotein YifL [Cocleimonas sp.]|jgi:predicted small lipoprotein YifL